MLRRAAIPTSTRIGSLSTCRTPGCAHWLPRWRPAYVRVSGTWANTTYFAESDETPATPPDGFRAVLSRERWKGVIDFARAASAEIMTSMATSPGVRDAAGLWQSDQARRLFAYTRSVGGRIAAAEFMNEPNLAAMGGAPKGYDAAAYGRDFKAFVAFIRASEPDAIVLGPGSIGETTASRNPALNSSRTRDLLAASGPGIDAFSYHHYGALSQRCSGIPGQTTPEAALSEAWLASTDRTLAYYRSLRDEFAPDKPMWLDRNRRDSLRRQSLGFHFPRYVPISRSAWPACQGRRPDGCAQHAGRKRLRPA